MSEAPVNNSNNNNNNDSNNNIVKHQHKNHLIQIGPAERQQSRVPVSVSPGDTLNSPPLLVRTTSLSFPSSSGVHNISFPSLPPKITTPNPIPVPPRTSSLFRPTSIVQNVSFRHSVSLPLSPTVPPRTTSLSLPCSPVQPPVPIRPDPIVFDRSSSLLNSSVASHVPVVPPRTSSLPISNTNHPTLKKKSPGDTQLDRLEKKIDILSKVCCHTSQEVSLVLKNTSGMKNSESLQGHFKRLETLEMLEEMEEKLKTNSIFMAETIYLLVNILKGISDVNERLSSTLDLLFDREFFSLFTWSGKSIPEPKLPLEKYIHVIALFKFVGGSNMVSVSDGTVKDFLVKKLNHGKARSDVKGLRHTVKRKKEA